MQPGSVVTGLGLAELAGPASHAIARYKSLDKERVALDHDFDLVFGLRGRKQKRAGGLGVVVATKGDHVAGRQKSSKICPMSGAVLVAKVRALVV